MATYKRIIDIDVMTEANETTNVLVEEAGSLKKIPSSKIGGSNVKMLFVWYEQNENYEIVNVGSNTTYAELLELYNNRTPFSVNCLNYPHSTEGEDNYFYIEGLYHMRIAYDLSYIELGFNNEVIFTFHSDETIEARQGGNG